MLCGQERQRAGQEHGMPSPGAPAATPGETSRRPPESPSLSLGLSLADRKIPAIEPARSYNRPIRLKHG